MGQVLTPERLVEVVRPIVDYIDEWRPEVVIGCDRGGRLASFAVFETWRGLHRDESFPTVDSKLHFARISKSTNSGDVQRRVREIMQVAALTGESPINKVLYIDDWINRGVTYQAALDALEEGVEGRFAVLKGDNADVVASKEAVVPTWNNKPHVIGVDYNSSDEINVVRHPASRAFRRRIANAARVL